MNSAIIVLGYINDKNGNLPPIAVSRCEAALLQYNKTCDCKVLCTGGYGEKFNTTATAHGIHMQNHLIQKGVNAADFLEVPLSSTTREDALLSKLILIQNSIDQVVLVTSDFHMKRAGIIFRHVMPDINFKYGKAKTCASKEEFKILVLHEKKSLKRFTKNVQQQCF
jgi:uncharacterized SAM-binding protein YcdF (DUF218 family)